MKKLCILLAIALLLGLAACGGTPEPELLLEATTTEIITTTEEQTEPAFEYIYLSEEEIEEIFISAWNAHANFYGVNVDWEDRIGFENRQEYHFRMLDPQLQSFASLEAAILEYFSPQLTKEFMDGFRSRYIEHEGGLYYAAGGFGDPGIEISSVRIEAQAETQITYSVQTMLWDGHEFNELGDSYIFVRELIDDNWVFTQFPRGWWIW